MKRLLAIILYLLSINFLGSFISTKAFNLRDIDQKDKNDHKVLTPVLRINTASSGGSGVIIGKKNNIYTLITAKHVIDLSSKNEIEIVTGINKFSNPKEVIKQFSNSDLALIRFTSEEEIPIAILPFLDEVYWNKISSWNPIYLEGFSNITNEITQNTRRKSEGKIVSVLQNNKDGYNLLHNAITNVGMSGGGIFAYPGGGLPLIVIFEENNSRYKYVSQSFLNNISILKSQYIQEEHNKLLDEFNRKINLQECLVLDPSKNEYYPLNNVKFFEQTCKQFAGRRFTVYDLKPPKNINSNMFSKKENQLFRKCMDGSWRNDKTLIMNIKLMNHLDGAGYRGHAAWAGKGNEEYDNRGRPSQLALYYDCLWATNYYDENKIKPCYLTPPKEGFLIGIQGRSESYTYGGKSGTGLGILLANKNIKNWLKERSEKYGLLLTNGDSVPKRFCNKG